MNGTHWPKNSPNRYRGFTQVQAGIQHSINTIAVQTLMAGGVPEAFAFATEKLGLDLEPEDMDAIDQLNRDYRSASIPDDLKDVAF